MKRRIPFPAAPLLALSLLLLLAAMWAGLLRMGWAWPLLRPTLPMAHGPLMVSGFLGALISLERAVALQPSVRGQARRLVYLPPLAAGLGGLLVMLGIAPPLGPLLMTMGSLGLVILMVVIYRLHPALHSSVILLGSILWLAGNLLWLFGQPVFEVTAWWTGFLALTIIGERLELSRLLSLSSLAHRLFLFLVVVVCAALIVSLIRYQPGMRLLGLTMLGMSIWLFVFDIARRRIRAGGQARFIAITLLLGYAWLAISGVLYVVFAGQMAGPRYDAMQHSFYLGFVFNMIFAHAPIVFPAILQRPLSYHPGFYLPPILLSLSLVLRITGDLTGDMVMRQWGGLLNAITLLLFLGLIIGTVLKDGRRQSARPSP